MDLGNEGMVHPIRRSLLNFVGCFYFSCCSKYFKYNFYDSVYEIINTRFDSALQNNAQTFC